MIGDNSLPVSAFSGVFSALSNLCIIIMVVLYHKAGMCVALLLSIVQFPMQIMRIISAHNLASIPGLFMNITTIIIIIIIYLGQSRLEKEQQRLSRLFEQTATALVNAIDAKDKYTHGHSSRVADYSRALAQMNGKSEKECDDIYHAALLHDVGKIGIPVSIINKEGKLTKEEYEYIKQHPVLGSQILEKIEEYPFLCIGARYHHERYDGKGYPEGLVGVDIPEMARIISVADAYDAMTSKRSYRDPIPQQKVREEIVKGIGMQFDPVYARLMVRMIDYDTEYELKEWEERRGYDGVKELVIGEYRSTISDGVLVVPSLTGITLSLSAEEETTGAAPDMSLILFDSLDGSVHSEDEEFKKEDLLYFEYAEIFIDGHFEKRGARKIEQKKIQEGLSGIAKKGDYKIEAVRIKDHALIRVFGKDTASEYVIALPDSTRFMYIAMTGSHCHLKDISIVRTDKECPEDYIPRIAEEISYINGPSGNIPNLQVDGYRSAYSEGIPVKDGLQVTFHAKSLPTARLVWHCPFIELFTSDNGNVDGANFRELAYLRLDGEFTECCDDCAADLSVRKTEEFSGWDTWKEFNKNGYEATVTVRIEGNRITLITANSGIAIRAAATVSNLNRTVYLALTGDQTAITNIRIH
ncbi:MAG: HD-GYP domain-containing protein [Lachnospiraceae bacterium]|nr:HD-GYP domain-containing protein [Lachnospiraceae bacterium]